MKEVVRIQVSLLTVGSKNNNNKHAEYLFIFIPFKCQIYSKQRSHASLLFGTCSNFSKTLVNIIFPCSGDTKVSTELIWPDKLRRRSKCEWKHEMNYVFLTKFSNTLFTKMLLLYRISLWKHFIYRGVHTSTILHGTTIPVTKN